MITANITLKKGNKPSTDSMYFGEGEYYHCNHLQALSIYAGAFNSTVTVPIEITFDDDSVEIIEFQAPDWFIEQIIEKSAGRLKELKDRDASLSEAA